ncbi:hypothetical protein F4703DRAFT_1827028 [Phycomyces blakesleeanus]
MRYQAFFLDVPWLFFSLISISTVMTRTSAKNNILKGCTCMHLYMCTHVYNFWKKNRGEIRRQSKRGIFVSKPEAQKLKRYVQKF